MKQPELTQQRRIEFFVFILGMAPIILVLVNQSYPLPQRFLSEKLGAPLVIIGMLFLIASFVIKVKRERKQRDFNILWYSRDIIRLLVGLGLAIYYLMQGKFLG